MRKWIFVSAVSVSALTVALHLTTDKPSKSSKAPEIAKIDTEASLKKPNTQVVNATVATGAATHDLMPERPEQHVDYTKVNVGDVALNVAFMHAAKAYENNSIYPPNSIPVSKSDPLINGNPAMINERDYDALGLPIKMRVVSSKGQYFSTEQGLFSLSVTGNEDVVKTVNHIDGILLTDKGEKIVDIKPIDMARKGNSIAARFDSELPKSNGNYLFLAAVSFVDGQTLRQSTSFEIISKVGTVSGVGEIGALSDNRVEIPALIKVDAPGYYRATATISSGGDRAVLVSGEGKIEQAGNAIISMPLHGRAALDAGVLNLATVEFVRVSKIPAFPGDSGGDLTLPAQASAITIDAQFSNDPFRDDEIEERLAFLRSTAQ